MCTDKKKKKKEKFKGKAGRKQKETKKNLLLPKYAEEHLKP